MAKPIPFFVDTIAIRPHSVSTRDVARLERRTTIRQFAKGEPCSLYQLEGGELECRTRSGRFMTGPEA